MSDVPPPSGDSQPPANPKAAAKAAKAYAKASRPWFKKKRWWALGAVAVLGIAGAASGGGGGSSSEDTASDDSSQISTPAAPESDASTPDAPTSAAPPAQPKPPATWKTVSKLNGNTDKSGPDFRLHGCDARLKYDVKGGSSMLVAIYVMESGTALMKDGGFPAVSPMESGPGETTLHQDKGDYYLDVKAANATWSATVQEKC